MMSERLPASPGRYLETATYSTVDNGVNEAHWYCSSCRGRTMPAGASAVLLTDGGAR